MLSVVREGSLLPIERIGSPKNKHLMLYYLLCVWGGAWYAGPGHARMKQTQVHKYSSME